MTGVTATSGVGVPAGRGSPPTSLRVRAARTPDAAELHALSQRAITRSAASHYAAEQLSAWAATRSVEGHRRFITEARTIVVVEDAAGGDERADARTDERTDDGADDGAVAGFLTLRDDPDDATAAEVDQLFVDPRAGGRGVARLLLDAAEDLARGAGHRRVRTHASWRAVPVFEAHGYRQVRVETVRLDQQVLTRALMVKDLDGERPGVR